MLRYSLILVPSLLHFSTFIDILSFRKDYLGWQLGAAKYVINLLEKECGGIAKHQPIVVLGAGIIGLFTSLELVDRGYTDITVIAAAF